jgi:hypothetical protein
VPTTAGRSAKLRDLLGEEASAPKQTVSPKLNRLRTTRLIGSYRCGLPQILLTASTQSTYKCLRNSDEIIENQLLLVEMSLDRRKDETALTW